MSSVSPPGSVIDPEEGGRGKRKGGKIRKESEHKRRLMMNQYFDELVTLLSMVTDAVSTRKMDKTTTLHEAVKLFKLYYDLDNKEATSLPSLGYRPGYLTSGEAAMFLLNSLNAFLMVISENGRILYITDLITSLTGHVSSQMVGQLVYDCVHQEDHCIIHKMLEPPASEDNISQSVDSTCPVISYPPQSFKCRFKIYSSDSSLSSSVCNKFSCLSYLRQWKDNVYDVVPSPSIDYPSSVGDDLSSLLDSNSPPSCLLIIGRLDTDTLSSIDEPIISTETDFNFDMRISKEGKVLDMSQQASLLLGYTSNELVGSLFFDYVDSFHLDNVSKSISTFLSKGLGVSQPFRLISKSSRYIWIIAKGYLSYNPWNHKPDHVLLQCKVLGCDEIPLECRFKQDSFYLPDLCGFESYKPEPVKQTQQQRLSCKESRSSLSSNPPLLSNTTSFSSNATSFPSNTTSLPSNNTPLPLPSNITHPQSSVQLDSPTTSIPRSMDEVCRELERKNQELFEMQRKVLEQQKLIEQERQQFYLVTNQVMSYIGSRTDPGGGGGGGDVLDNISIHPNMAMMIRNATSPLQQQGNKSQSYQLTDMGGHMTNPTGHMTNPTGHTTNPSGHISGHMTNPSGHMTNPSGHMTNPSSHMTNRTGHMTNPTGHMTNPTGHMTNPSGHMTNPSGHMTNPSGHMTNRLYMSEYNVPSPSLPPFPPPLTPSVSLHQNTYHSSSTHSYQSYPPSTTSTPSTAPPSSSAANHCLPLSSTQLSPHQVYRFY